MTPAQTTAPSADRFSEPAPALPLSVRSRAWPAWRLHALLLVLGSIAGVAITAWDLSYATRCRGPLPCIDYTGVALGVYWVVFVAQAVVSSAMMLVLRRSPRRFFASHLVSAAAVLVLVVGGVVALFSTVPS